MSFSKAPLHRFNETVSCSPSPSKYVPSVNNKVKGLIPYNNQKGARFQPNRSAERCCSQNSVKNTSEVNSRVSMNRDGDYIEIQGEAKIRAKQTGSHASISYAPHHPPVGRRIAGSFIDMPTATNTPTPKRSASKGPLVTDKQNKRGFETQFHAKRKKLSTMKKELLEKQKSIVEAYSSLADLRDKVLTSTGKDLGPVEEIKLVDLGDLKSLIPLADSHPSKKQQAEGAGEALAVNSVPLTALSPDLFAKLEKRLQEIPECCMELCTSAVTKRDAISDLLKNLAASGKTELEENEVHELLERFVQEGSDLCKQLEKAKNYQSQTIAEVLEEIRGAWVVQGPSPKSEAPEDLDRLELQEKLELLVVENTNLTYRLKGCTEDLEYERDRGNTLKDRKSSVDVQLKTARQKIRDMEQKLLTDEVKIAQLLSQMKSLEGQIKTKETSFDHKSRELLKTNKATGEKVAKLEKQRESLELRVLDLKKSIDTKEEEAVTVITDLQNKLNDAIKKLQEEHNLRTKVESELMVNKQRMLEVEEKGRELAAMAEKTKSIIVTGEESKHSEREVELWTDLQSTRVLLKSAEGQINILKEEKAKFMDTMNKATISNKVKDEGNLKEICNKYCAEMVTKDEQLRQMQEQVKDLMDSIANTQEQNALLDKQVKDYQDRNNAQTEHSTATAEMQVQVSELQQQILDLQATLQEVVRQNEQMEQALTQKQLEVEQRDRVMREQSKVLKVRDELIGLLKGKEQRQDEQITTFQATLDEREKNANKVNKEIAAKAEEMQELYSTLESKQIQVMRLEKLVKQMEEQQERVQAQRTRHEARIAQLEHALQEKRNPRYCTKPTHRHSKTLESIWNQIQELLDQGAIKANLSHTPASAPKLVPDHETSDNNRTQFTDDLSITKIQTPLSFDICDRNNKSEIEFKQNLSKRHNLLQNNFYKVSPYSRTVNHKSSHNENRKNYIEACGDDSINQLLNDKCKNSVSLMKEMENGLNSLYKHSFPRKASSHHKTECSLPSSKRRPKYINHTHKQTDQYSETCIRVNERDFRLSLQEIDGYCSCYCCQEKSSLGYQTENSGSVCNHKLSSKSSCNSFYSVNCKSQNPSHSSYSNESNYDSIHSEQHFNQNKPCPPGQFNKRESHSVALKRGPTRFVVDKASCFWYPNSNVCKTPSSVQIYKLVKVNKFAF